MNNEQIVMYDSPEAASIKTVTGWVDRLGVFWASDEHMARYSGATHRVCSDCGSIVEMRSYCESCHKAKEIKEWQEMPRVAWNGEDMLYEQASGKFFDDIDDILDYCYFEKIPLEQIRLVICEPHKANEVSVDARDLFCDVLHEDGEVPEDIADAVQNLNDVIQKCEEIFSWTPGNVVPSSESIKALAEEAEGSYE